MVASAPPVRYSKRLAAALSVRTPITRLEGTAEHELAAAGRVGDAQERDRLRDFRRRAGPRRDVTVERIAAVRLDDQLRAHLERRVDVADAAGQLRRARGAGVE